MIAYYPGRHGGKVEQPLNGLPGTSSRADLKEFTQGDEGEDDPGVLKK